MGVLKSVELTGFLAFAPAFAGTNWADVNRRIIQNCPHGRGRGLSSPPVWFRLCRLREAQQHWWVRNASIQETLASLEREIGMPRAKAFLDYFNTLQRSLRQQIEDQQNIGNVGYTARCDGVLKDLTRGRLDYRPSAAASGAG